MSNVGRYKEAVRRLKEPQAPARTSTKRRGRPQREQPQKIMAETIKASAVVEHSSQCSHDLQPSIICRESRLHLRRVKEALFIRNNRTINRDKGVEVSAILHFGDELSDLIAQVNAFVPPTPFLEHPGEPVIPFRTWIRIFNNYSLAAFPAKLCDERKQAILLNSLDVEGQRLFYALPPPEPTYEATLRALELFFTQKVNVYAERHRFQSRHQVPNESVDHYIVSLRELVSLCAFGPLEDEMIRDQLVEGTSSSSIRERLLSLCELTLETALTVARQMESAKKDAVIISTPEANVSVQMTKRYSSQNARRSNDRSVSSQRCYHCGSTLHLANYPRSTHSAETAERWVILRKSAFP
ncbi:hypothetical protein M514_23447 [Trichuris suis]|uniref:Retrotransposon gag domain-containing protein n=1 Tax=Trichuris suis TaxID=68888 RepID=A0A085N4M7_9BILA|nr:hypothetical protein M514_23447 [Trichuris suis]